MQTYLLKEETAITGEGDDSEARQADEANIGVLFENFVHLLIVEVK